jgi:hypothetical protein
MSASVSHKWVAAGMDAVVGTKPVDSWARIRIGIRDVNKFISLEIPFFNDKYPLDKGSSPSYASHAK